MQSNEGNCCNQGEHDRTPVTTKHEKRHYANPLFRSELLLFSREAISLKTPFAGSISEIGRSEF